MKSIATQRSNLEVPEPLPAIGSGESVIVPIGMLHEYLKAHGYRVVRATWPEREPRPLLIVEDECQP